ncbi:CASP-like protein 4A3, partial [Mucuna pruriens]
PNTREHYRGVNCVKQSTWHRLPLRNINETKPIALFLFHFLSFSHHPNKLFSFFVCPRLYFLTRLHFKILATQTNANGKRRIATHEDHTAAMKKSLSKNSESSTQFDSPLRFHSPMRWDGTDPPESPEYRSPENSPEKHADNSMAIVTVDKFKQFTPEKRAEHRKPQETTPSAAVTVLNDSRMEQPQRPAAKAGPRIGGDERGARSAAAGWKTEEALSKAALGFRLSEVVVCLISFSVMAADKTQGWSGDSFDRYREYRYCLSVNVIGFAYSALQACDLTCQLATGKHLISHHLRYHFDFLMDQASSTLFLCLFFVTKVLAYLLISASSSAATRVDDWQSNWGKDEFTEMATASIGMAFLAFVAFAMSSLISGYTLCNRTS